jgi:hypothetical protein
MSYVQTRSRIAWLTSQKHSKINIKTRNNLIFSDRSNMQA